MMAIKFLSLPFVFTLALTHAVAAESRSKDTPLSKVIDLLSDMMVKGKKAMEAEQVEFAKSSTWCSNTKASLANSIKEAAAEIEQLQATSAKAAADAETLAGEIEDLDAEIIDIKAQEENATGIRTEEHASFTATETDFSESIDAIKRAIQVLKARTADVPQSLLQVARSKLLSAKAKATLTSFISMAQQEPDTEGPPQANAYEFQSSSVIDMLEKLLHKFSDQLLALQKAEMNAKFNYQELMQQLADDKKQAKASVAAKTEAKAERIAAKAQAEQDRTVVENSKAEDEKTLATTTTECDLAAEEYKKNQKLRADELVALEKAVEILTSEDVSGNAEKHLPKPVLLQRSVKVATAMAQLLRAGGFQDEKAKHKAMELLQAQARKTGSKYLATIAAHIASDPFGKVKKMIKDLIVKLQEQANAEADQNAYCQTELATNKMTREDKTAEVDKLSAQLDELSATSAQLAKEIATLSDEIAELRGQQAEATKLREEQKAENAVTVADAKVAQVAVQKAKHVLAEYYAMAANAFIQKGADKEPYKGMQVEGGNILDFLEVVLSDFARLEAETSAEEEEAQADYKKFMAETDQDIAVKDTEMKHKDSTKAETDERARSTKKELELTQEELTAAMNYYDKLKAECVDTGLSYADRKEAREQEIQSLKEALLVLNGEDIA